MMAPDTTEGRLKQIVEHLGGKIDRNMLLNQTLLAVPVDHVDVFVRIIENEAALPLQRRVVKLEAALRDLLQYPAGDYSSHGDHDAAWQRAIDLVGDPNNK